MTTLIHRLRALDVCAVSDALDAAGRPGVVLGLSRLSGDHRFAGFAVTVELVPSAHPPIASTRHLGTAAIEASGPDSVIVIDNGARDDVSGWGGTLSLAAVQRGVQGVIVDGACRDLDESRALGLPIFASTAVPLTARGRVVERDWNVPITIRGLRVDPGMLVIADSSGIAFIAAEFAEETITAAERIVDRERQMAERVRRGDRISEVMGADYETLVTDINQTEGKHDGMRTQR
jgi:4-hydroxy-4-methyl-2-oxoglutarate aldolase